MKYILKANKYSEIFNLALEVAKLMLEEKKSAIKNPKLDKKIGKLYCNLLLKIGKCSQESRKEENFIVKKSGSTTYMHSKENNYFDGCIVGKLQEKKDSGRICQEVRK